MERERESLHTSIPLISPIQKHDPPIHLLPIHFKRSQVDQLGSLKLIMKPNQLK